MLNMCQAHRFDRAGWHEIEKHFHSSQICEVIVQLVGSFLGGPTIAKLEFTEQLSLDDIWGHDLRRNWRVIAIGHRGLKYAESRK